MKIIDLKQNTPEWLDRRRHGIGASETPAVFGESPYMTRRELFLDKKGLLAKEAGKEFIFSRGHEAEKTMRGEILAYLGREFIPLFIQHPDFDYMIASLDGFSDDFGVLETKLVGKEVLKAALEKGEIPRHHWIQMQKQMVCARVDHGKWFGSDLKNNGAIVDVKQDKDFALRIFQEEAEFWHALQNNLIPPLSDRDTLEPENTEDFEHLQKYKNTLDLAQAAYDFQLELVKGKFAHPKVSCAGIDLLTIERAGSISYSKIPEIKNLAPEYLEKFRGAPAKYVKVTFKDKA